QMCIRDSPKVAQGLRNIRWSSSSSAFPDFHGLEVEILGSGVIAADAFLTAKNIPHLFRINSGGHEPKVWMNDLYWFAPMLFKSSRSEPSPR
ncbi:MAG: hypothetical protein N2689_01540, partial [Verrucomicrobiae bacterium]|nr:hypothetical protein [Verrucomicrobiae bacterium]